MVDEAGYASATIAVGSEEKPLQEVLYVKIDLSPQQGPLRDHRPKRVLVVSCPPMCAKSTVMSSCRSSTVEIR